MDFASFFKKQKQTKRLCKRKQYKKTDQVNQIFSQYLFVEDTLQKSNLQTFNKEQNIYSSFVQYSSLTNCTKPPIQFNSIKLDIFAYYLSIQLAFKVTHNIINSRPNNLAFFCYYNNAFSNNFAIIKSLSIANNKYTRIHYQRNLQSIRQSTFLRNGTQSSLGFFNNLFIKNNTDVIILKKRNANLFVSKFRSTKTLRSVVLKKNVTKRFKSLLKAKLLHTMCNRRNIAFYKKVSAFPQNQWYRNKMVKVRIRQKGIKSISTAANVSVTHQKKSGTYHKPLTPTTFQFKLYPTIYEESTLNPSRFAQFKALSSFMLNSRVSFYQINALSLTRYIFDSQIKQWYSTAKNKLSKPYLANIERVRLSRNRSIGVCVKDLIRVCFFSMHLKKTDFLATFFASTISNLSNKGKELPFVRFLITLLKMFASQNKDILGVHIRFQGRLNRWRRTKHICGSKGKLTFSSYATHVEYGIGQAITRKGTLGVHIWIAYNPHSSTEQKELIKSYRGLPITVIHAK